MAYEEVYRLDAINIDIDTLIYRIQVFYKNMFCACKTEK